MATNKELGDYGESTAARFLMDRGYEILENKYRGVVGGEIDLIVKKDGCIVFVEVKFRRSLKYGYPREAVGHKKRQRIRKGAMMYIASREIQNMDFRFDVIEILGSEKITIEHIENAF